MIGNIIEKSGNAPGRMICSVPIPSTKFTIQTRQTEKSLAPAGLQGLMPKLQSKSEGTFASEEDSFNNQLLIDNMTKEQFEEALSDVQSMISLKNVQFLRKTNETTNIVQSSTSIAKSTKNIVKSGVEEFTSFDKSITKGLGDSKATSDAARFNLNGCRVVVKDTMIKEFQELVNHSLQCTESQQKHTSHDQAQEYVQQFVNDVLTSGFCVVFDAVSAALQPQHELLNHEAMPDSPGYTLHEICEMFRSEYPNQQSLAMRMLGGVLRRREVLTSLRAYACAHTSICSSSGYSCSSSGSELLLLHSKGKNEFSCLQMASSRLMRSLGSCPNKHANRKLLSQLIDQLLCLCGADSLPPSIPSLLLWTVRLPRSSDIQRLAKFACLKEYLCSSTETTYASVLWRGVLGAYGAVPLPTPHMKRPTSSSYEKHFFDCVEKYRSPEAESTAEERDESEEVSREDNGTDLSDSFVLACRWSRIDAFVEQGGLIAQLVRSFSDSLREIRSAVISSSSSRPETNQVKVSQSIAVASLEILGGIVTSAGSENTLSTVCSEFLVPTFPSVVQIVRSYCDAAQTLSSTVAVQFVAEWLRVLTELSRRHSPSERLLFSDLSSGGNDFSLVLSSLLQSSLQDVLQNATMTVTVSGVVDSPLRDWRSAVGIWSMRLLRVSLTCGHGLEVLLELLPSINSVLEGSTAANSAGDTHNFQQLCDMRLELFLVLEQAAVSIAACGEEQLLVLLSADRVDAVVCALLHIAQDVVSGWCQFDSLNSNSCINISSNSNSSNSSSNRFLLAAQLNFLRSVVGVPIPTSSRSESSSSSSGNGSTHQLCAAVLAGSSFRSRGLLAVVDKLIKPDVPSSSVPCSSAGAASALLSTFQTATETCISPDSIAAQVESLLDVRCGTQANDMQQWELSELFIAWQRLSLVVQSRRSSATSDAFDITLPSSLPLETVSVADGLLCWQASRLQQLSQLLLLHSHCLSRPQLVETTLLTTLERLNDSWSGCSVFLLGAYVRHCLTGVNVTGAQRDDCERAVTLSVLGFEVQPAVAAENRTGLSVAPFNAPFGALAGQPASHSAAHWVLNCFTGRLPLSPMWPFRCLSALRGAHLVTWLQVLQRQETTLSTATTAAATPAAAAAVSNKDLLGVETLGEKLFCLVSLTLPENAAVWMREEGDPQTWGAVSDDNTGDTFSALFCSLVAKLTHSAVSALSSLAHDKFSKLNVAAALRKRQNAPSSSSSQPSNASALLQLCDKVVDGALEQCTHGEMHAAVLSLFLSPRFPWAVKERVWSRLGEARLLHLVESVQVWATVLVDTHLLCTAEDTVEDTPSTWAGKRRLCGCILSAVRSLRQVSDRSWVIVSLGLLSVAKMLFAEAFQKYQESGTDGLHSLEVTGESAKFLHELLNSPSGDCWVVVGVVAAAQFWFLDKVQITQIDQTAAAGSSTADSLLTTVLELGSRRAKALGAQVALLAPEMLNAAVRVDSAGTSILLGHTLFDLVAAAVIHS